MDAITVLPVLAAGFAIPQFIPQILKLHRTNDAAGLSTPWALLTGINNAAWFGYFAASHYWFALIPATSAALLGGNLGIMLNRRHTMTRRGWMTIGAWTLVLGVTASIDQRLLGATLTAAFLIQVIPAVTTAYRTRHPTGIARGTWRLILAEVSCWATFGTAKRDGPLIILGTTGVISALLMLHRARTTANQPAANIRHTEHRHPTPAQPSTRVPSAHPGAGDASRVVEADIEQRHGSANSLNDGKPSTGPHPPRRRSPPPSSAGARSPTRSTSRPAPRPPTPETSPSGPNRLLPLSSTSSQILAQCHSNLGCRRSARPVT